jgi:peptidoglycan/xylan/chitin deacetylase (PgdA/CDA1 family)
MTRTVNPRTVLAASAVAPLVNLLPSVAALGQWTSLRTCGRAGIRWRGPRSPRVALTFDDGPAPGETDAVLAQLAQLRLPATFFCLGERARREPELVRELLARGHQVELHGFRHRSHLGLTPRAVGRDLHRGRAELEALGVTPHWFRPPYGHVTAASVWHARRQRVQLVLWSVMGREWAEPDAAAVGERIGRGLHAGAIVLLHDADTAPGSVGRVVGSLPRVAAEIDRRGLRAVTLDQLVS